MLLDYTTMVTYIKQIGKWLSSRLALNIYFWAFLFILKQGDADDQHVYSTAFYYGVMLFYMSIFATFVYFNNLLLVPKLLFKKRRLLYFSITTLLVFVTAFLYTYLLKLLPQIYPGLNSLEMSVVMDPTSDDMSFLGIVNDMQTYLVFMVVFVLVFSLSAIYHHSKQKMQHMQEAINKHREAELAFLKNQLNPHFLFNTLNNVYALSLKKSDDAPEAILKLSNILRYILYESNHEMVPFNKEKDIIQSYIDVELLRLTETSKLQFVISANNNTQIPPLLWIPVLENAFKHGRSIQELEIDFRFTLQQNELIVFCKNNKSLQAKPTVTGGIGLANLQKRLQLLFPNKHQIVQQSDENYFIIEVKIKL